MRSSSPVTSQLLSPPLRAALGDALWAAARDPRSPAPLFELARRVNLYWHLGRGQRGLAHELNNPLAVLLVCVATPSADATRAEGSSEEDAIDVRRQMLGACDSLEGLLRLAGEAADLGRGVASILDLDECVRGALTMANHALRYRMEVRFDRGAAPHVRARPEVLWQVLLNVLLNAASAQREWGILEVRTFAEGGRCGIEIADGGPGFSTDDLAGPLVPLRCGWPDTDGLGLGLFVSDVLLRGEGGSLERANRPRGGAKITISLPDGAGRGLSDL